MKIFLSLAAVLAWLFGLGLLLAPGGFYAPLGIPVTPLFATVAQAHGATLFGLGVITWIGRNAQGQGLKALLLGSLVVQILSFVVALRTVMLVGIGASAALVIHTVLGTFFAYFLLKNWKNFSK